MSKRAAILAEAGQHVSLCRCMVCGRTIDPSNELCAGELILGDGLDSGSLFWGIERPNRIVVRCWRCEQAKFALQSGAA